MEYAVAIDFDGTIVENKFPHIGKLKPFAQYAIEWLQEHYDRVYLWTCRFDNKNESTLTDAKEFLKNHGILLDDYQEWEGVKKVAQFYIDDRGVPPFMGWLSTMYIISKVENKELPGDFPWEDMYEELGEDEVGAKLFLDKIIKLYPSKYFN